MKKTHKIALSILSFFAIITINLGNEGVVYAESYCDYDKIDKDRPHGDKFLGSDTYDVGEKKYSNFKVTYTGADKVYDEELTKKDFKVTADWTWEQEKNIRQKYYYKSINGGVCKEVKDASEIIGKEKVASKKGTEVKQDFTLTTKGSKEKGEIIYTASYAGAEASHSSYWVKDVNITAPGDKDYHFEEYRIEYTCKLVYGDGETKNCSKGNRDVAETDALSDKVKDAEYTKMSGEVNKSLNEFISINKDDGIKTTPTGYGTRIHPDELANAQKRAKDNTPSETIIREDNGVVGQYEYDFGRIFVFSYVDKETGKSDYKVKRTFNVMAIDVEDTTRSPQKKEVYAQNKVWNNGQEYRKDINKDIVCKIYYFGGVSDKDCSKDIEIEENANYKNYKHTDGTEDLQAIFGGTNITVGNWYRYIEYEVMYDDEKYAFTDNDFRTILYASKMEVNDAYDESYNDGSGLRDYNIPMDVIVSETHVRGKKTPKTYATQQGYKWHSYQETYENFKQPTCKKTYAPSRVNKKVKTENCSKDMYYQYASVNQDYKQKTDKEYWYEYGQSVREGTKGYVENGLDAYQRYYFHYPNKIDIQISKSKTYQDEPYPTTTCTKYYDTGDTRSCSSKMYIEKDTGQNKKMNGERKVTFNYINNDKQDKTNMTRVYAHKIDITAPATSGKSGFRGDYTSLLTWQDGTTKDVSLIKDVWRSEICSTGEEVKYLNSPWSYTDSKGKVHGTTRVNEFYIPDTVAKQYCISATYPKTQYDNGLTPGWSYVGDKKAPVVDEVKFKLIGIKSIQLLDNTVTVHEIDTDKNGTKLQTKFGEVSAKTYTGNSNKPNTSLSPILAFNKKTYQTGHWYDFRTKINWSDGSTEYVEDTGNHPEMTFRYLNKNDNWSYNYSGEYPVSGTNGFFPTNSNDHRILREGWNGVRFDLFSESGVRKPSGQSSKYEREYTAGYLWAHSPDSVTIAGPSVIKNKDETQSYKGYINWNDGDGIKQDATVVGNKSNPWGQYNRFEVTNLQVGTIWEKEEKRLTTPVSGALKVSFPEVTGDKLYRTLYLSYGDKDRTLPGFQYWDYVSTQLDVYLYQALTTPGSPSAPDACSNITVPKMGCPLPTDNNYRLPQKNEVIEQREVEFGIKLRVNGVSSGTGE